MSLYFIVALRNEKGSYNRYGDRERKPWIVALRNEKGNYSMAEGVSDADYIVAL